MGYQNSKITATLSFLFISNPRIFSKEEMRKWDWERGWGREREIKREEGETLRYELRFRSIF